MAIDHSENSREKTINNIKTEHHHNLVSDAWGHLAAVAEKPKQTTAVEDLYSAGASLLNAVWKVNEAEAKAVIGTAQTVGQLAKEHPAEVAVTGATGLPGLILMKGGQEVYAENKDYLASVVNGVADAGTQALSQVARFSQDASERMSDNFTHKPLTTALKFVVHPLLPML